MMQRSRRSYEKEINRLYRSRVEARQQASQARATSASSSVDTPTREAKRRRCDAATAEEEDYDTLARALLTKEGLDPDDLNKVCRTTGNRYPGTTPLIHFSAKGNFKMVRYLASRGADGRQEMQDGSFPMLAAAENGHFEIVQFLYHEGGAHDDIRKSTINIGYSPLSRALFHQHFDIAKWLILKGAFAPYDDVEGGDIDYSRMRDIFYSCLYIWPDDKRLDLLSWARGAVTTHENVLLLLLGTIESPSSSSSSSPLEKLNGKSGILELVVNYVGNPTPHELRIFRRLMDLLPTFIKEKPFATEDDDDDDDY